jgi:hypothetical protein
MDSSFKEYVSFTTNEMEPMAKFLAELTKEGIKFFIQRNGEFFNIQITGF